MPELTDEPTGDHTDQRLRALLDVSVSDVRESAGRHEYDGKIQDLSLDGITQALRRVGPSTQAASAATLALDPHDEAHLSAFEESALVRFGELELHRRNPLIHAENLDLSCYDRPYAPDDIRREARRAHLAQWPDAVDMACESLDLVPAPVATALLSAVRGLKDSITAGEAGSDAALAAHARLVEHVEQLARSGAPEIALGRTALERLMGADEAIPDVNLSDL
ncbi:MAG: DUF885 domain-containing protein, partial [Actinomycetes bacterium]